MRSKHIVVLRNNNGSRTEKPVVLAGCETRIGNALAAFISPSAGMYFKVRAKNLGSFRGENRPCKSVRPMNSSEVPDFVKELGGDKMLTVIYEKGVYKVTFGGSAPSYLKWCLKMLAGMFVTELYHSIEGFLRSLKGKPRPRAAMQAAAEALIPDMYQGIGRGRRWLELEFNGRFLKGDPVKEGEKLDTAKSVTSIWNTCLEQAVKA